MSIEADLLEKRGIVEKYRLTPQLFTLEMPNDDCAHAHRLSGCGPTQKSTKMSSSPLVFGYNTVFVRAENATDTYGKIGEPNTAIRFAEIFIDSPLLTLNLNRAKSQGVVGGSTPSC